MAKQADLAGDGVFFRNVTSVAGYTHEAVPAILTGDRVHAENVTHGLVQYVDQFIARIRDANK